MLLVSDALDLAGLPPGEYIRGERKLLLTSEVVKFPEENVLAGAASPISRCIEVMMEFTQCSLEEAIRMTSTNPARMFGLSELGGIDAGKKGNLIVFELSDRKIKIQKTFVEGKQVFAKQP